MIEQEDLIKIKVQRTIVIFSTLILIGKFLAFYLTNSVGVLTDAMESIVNVTAGFISLISIRWGAQPRDKEHPFGHGKIELISASLEGLLILVAGLIIIYEGIYRLFSPSEINQLDIGIYIVALSGVINFLMGSYSIRIGKKYNSIALIAGGRHLHSDTYSTIGLVVGLVLLYITKLIWIDSALALIFGGVIAFTGISILRKTIANLVDRADMKLISDMVNSINAHRKENWIDIHNMKILKYGNHLFIDCDITLPWFYNLIESHEVCNELRDVLNADFSGKAQASIHSDPCTPSNCSECVMHKCVHRKNQFLARNVITVENVILSDEERINRLKMYKPELH